MTDFVKNLGRTEAEANPNAKITIDQYGISGNLSTTSDIAATDENALAGQIEQGIL